MATTQFKINKKKPFSVPNQPQPTSPQPEPTLQDTGFVRPANQPVTNTTEMRPGVLAVQGQKTNPQNIVRANPNIIVPQQDMNGNLIPLSAQENAQNAAQVSAQQDVLNQQIQQQAQQNAVNQKLAQNPGLAEAIQNVGAPTPEQQRAAFAANPPGLPQPNPFTVGAGVAGGLGAGGLTAAGATALGAGAAAPLSAIAAPAVAIGVVSALAIESRQSASRQKAAFTQDVKNMKAIINEVNLGKDPIEAQQQYNAMIARIQTQQFQLKQLTKDEPGKLLTGGKALNDLETINGFFQPGGVKDQLDLKMQLALSKPNPANQINIIDETLQ